MIVFESDRPFSIRFDKENPFDRALPLTPFEFNALCNNGVFDIPPHRHNHLEIMIAESESAVHRINGKEYPARAETICIFTPHHVHSLRNDSESYINAWYVDFDLGFILTRIKDKAIAQKIFTTLFQTKPYLECSGGVYAEVRKIMRELVHSVNRRTNPAANPDEQFLVARLIEIVLSLCKEEQRVHDEWWAPQYLTCHFAENISINGLAQKTGRNIGQLNRFFEREFGETASKMLTEIRMGFAGSLLLAYPALNIKEVAERCGIASESTFFRLFKNHYGMTPKEYRRIILKRFFDKTVETLPVVLNHDLLLSIYRQHSQELTLKAFAQSNGLNPIQLKKDFDQCMGESFSRYVEDIRILHAKNILSMTSLPIDEVGQLVGYQQARSFTRAFSRKVGETPSNYRKRFTDLAQYSSNLPLS